MEKSLAELETSETEIDEHNIRKLYHDAINDRKQEWYFDMNNPTRPGGRLGNYKNANLQRESDGSWSVTGATEFIDGKWRKGKGQVRLEGWSESGSKKWLNMEITVYAFYMFDIEGPKIKPARKINYVFQLYGRGGHHGGDNKCDGACYKIGLLKEDGDIAVRKEPHHPFYLKTRGKKEGTKKNVRGRWIGLKQVLYNFKVDGKDCVANEIWIDDESDDNGELDVHNKWRNVSNVNDTGGWGMQGLSDEKKEEFKKDCPRLDENENHEHRKAEDIINMPGGTNEGNIGSLRSDAMKLKFKYFSIREIKPPRPDKDAEEA